MTYAAWEPRYRVTTISPGKLDLFVVTFIDGKRATLEPIMEYDAALARAHTFHRDRKCQVKVLPMTGTEVLNMLGISRPDHPEPMEDALRQKMIDTLTQIVRESSDPDARTDALDLLADMGVMTR